MTKAVLKKPTNVTIRSDLLDEARALKINLSQEFEQHLSEVVRKQQGELWKRENREAIKAYNKFVEENGIWSDEFRTW